MWDSYNRSRNQFRIDVKIVGGKPKKDIGNAVKAAIMAIRRIKRKKKPLTP